MLRYVAVGMLRSFGRGLKAGTHERACSRSTLLQHAPGAKLPRLHQRLLRTLYLKMTYMLVTFEHLEGMSCTFWQEMS